VHGHAALDSYHGTEYRRRAHHPERRRHRYGRPLRSLVVSHYLLGTEEIMVINHTDCGLMHTSEQDLRNRIQNRTGTAAVSPAFFYAFQNIEENVRHQLQKLRTHPWIPEKVAVRGFVYDVSSGLLREIKHT
jgi:carbonic anhydrase